MIVRDRKKRRVDKHCFSSNGKLGMTPFGAGALNTVNHRGEVSNN